jgi:hypothetical protein
MRKPNIKSKKPRLKKPRTEDFIHHPHDAYLRYMLSHVEVVLELVQFVMIPEMFATIDWDSLQLDKDTFTDKRMKSTYADTVYRAKLKDSEREIIIRFIKEYKSTKIEQPVTPQLLRYVSASLDNDLRQKIPMALPIPILIYNGEAPWVKEQLSDHFADVPALYKEYVPDFAYILLNLHDLSAEKIMGLSFLYLPNILLALKIGRSKQKVLDNYNKIVIFAQGKSSKELAINFFQATMVYLNSINTLTDKEMTVLLENLPTAEKIAGKTTYQQILEKGEEKGMEKGMEKIILNIIISKPDYSDNQIASLCGVDVLLVSTLRNKFQKSASN